jgi:hypothetical protein
MKYWIQRADFEASDFEVASASALITAFESHDWAEESSYCAERAAIGGEWCPPGFGIVPGDGRILHLCPESDSHVHCHYHFLQRQRFLAIFTREQQRTETWLDRRATIPHLIQMFYDDRHQDLLDHVRQSA